MISGYVGDGRRAFPFTVQGVLFRAIVVTLDGISESNWRVVKVTYYTDRHVFWVADVAVSNLEAREADWACDCQCNHAQKTESLGGCHFDGWLNDGSKD